uniref:Tyrosyl-DNA phosphodiesterase 2 n=1 Tax=Sphenodon punctatus TaxID=8508 RepID=A0A8D0GSH6_SPHPU
MEGKEQEEQQEQEAIALVQHRQLLCGEFASIASCDLAVAQCYLAENDWDKQRALNSYFEPPIDEQDLDEMPQTLAVPDAYVDLTDDATGNTSVQLDSAQCISATANTTCSGQQEDGSSFSLLTWNIDGLDLVNLQERAQGVCAYIALYSPDVVFLQEVISPYLGYLQKRAVSYTVIPANTEGYFAAIMLKNSRVRILRQEITPYPTTSMMRNLLTINASICGNEFCLMTSHLESTKDHSSERLNQLKLVLQKMQEAPKSATVIFGGDTNLRDQEVAKLGGLPSNVLDVWEFLGKPEHCQYTWDTHSNTNLELRFKCKMRFDRLFFRAASESVQVIPQSLDLIGLEKLDCGKFPSDHWGLLCNFDVIL